VATAGFCRSGRCHGFPGRGASLGILWRRFQREGKIDGSSREPEDPVKLCDHPINFLVGGLESLTRVMVDVMPRIV
jgi:hypothetical protein